MNGEGLKPQSGYKFGLVKNVSEIFEFLVRFITQTHVFSLDHNSLLLSGVKIGVVFEH